MGFYFQRILSKTGVKKNSYQKYDSCFDLATETGLEPATTRSTVLYANQLRHSVKNKFVFCWQLLLTTEIIIHSLFFESIIKFIFLVFFLMTFGNKLYANCLIAV